MSNSTRNPRSRGTTAQHLAQTDRRRAEHEARANKIAGVTSEPPISPEAVAAYRSLIAPGVEFARQIREQRDAEQAARDASYAEFQRQQAAGITPPRPPMLGTKGGQS
jgi:hypothetical protein